MLLVSCGTDRLTSMQGLALAKLHPETLRAFVGVHPSEAVRSKGLRWLGKAAVEASGLGEIGLDPTYSSVGPRGSQVKVLTAQLELAQKLRKPVQVHSRKAERGALEVLGGFRLTRVLMHWFEGEELLPAVMDGGYYVSFGPALLYSKRLHRMASRYSRDLVLTETDSPVGYSPLGGVHGPSLIPSVVYKLAEIWKVGFEEARATVAANSARFLGPRERLIMAPDRA